MCAIVTCLSGKARVTVFLSFLREKNDVFSDVVVVQRLDKREGTCGGARGFVSSPTPFETSFSNTLGSMKGVRFTWDPKDLIHSG